MRGGSAPRREVGPHVHRGSRRKLREIKLRQNTPTRFYVVLGVILATFLALFVSLCVSAEH